MKSEPQGPGGAGRFEEEGEWRGEHQRRKRTWSDEDRRQRKERRHPGSNGLDDAPEPMTSEESPS